MQNKDLPRVTGILQAEGLIDFSKVRKDIMERAQAFGTAVHKATELWDKGMLNLMKLDPLLIPYLEGWKKFKSDYGVTISPEEIERQLISIKWGFKGTPDRWPMVQGKRTLIDLKSSTSMYPATSIQTAAYQILLEENSIKIQQRWGVKLTNEGTYKIEPYTKLSDRTTFLSALNLYKWKKENL